MSAGRQGPFVQPAAVLRRRRCLPVDGEVMLEVGDRVDSHSVVARACERGALHTINAAARMDMRPADLPARMLVSEGDLVVAGQVLARSRGLFGLFAMECRAPVTGTVAAVSPHTGRILLEEPGTALDLEAYLPGIVVDRHEKRGVTVAGWAARVGGVFGVGGEVCGPLVAAVGRSDAVLEAAALDGCHAGAVLLGGARITAEALQRAQAVGVAGIITGGVHDGDLSRWLGHDVVLADSTHLEAPLTLVVVGGFGRTSLETSADRLLRSLVGRVACLSGHTRVRAGARRPEVIIPLDREPAPDCVAAAPPPLAVGSRVMCVREPWFGRLGRVGCLPDEPQDLPTGANLIVAHVDLDDGQNVMVPLVNLEVLDGPDEEVRR